MQILGSFMTIFGNLSIKGLNRFARKFCLTKIIILLGVLPQDSRGKKKGREVAFTTNLRSFAQTVHHSPWLVSLVRSIGLRFASEQFAEGRGPSRTASRSAPADRAR